MPYEHRIAHLLGATLCCLIATHSSHAERDYPVRPIDADRVRVDDDFWSSRLETNRKATIPFAFDKCERTGRIENFRVAGGLSDGKWRGQNGYDDCSVSKVIEGASYSLMTHPDEATQAYLAELVGYYAAAQEDDGYLYTLWTARDTIDIHKVRVNPGDDRWGRLDFAHQLYNLGHMFEAGVAHYRATGDTAFLDICRMSADCVAENFGLGKIEAPPGHQEIEIGLVKLYRATGDRRYLNLAKFFLDARGKPSQGRRLYGTYSQDHKPVVQQSTAVGHAVRACYMYAGMTDVAALTGNQEYLAAIDRIWKDVVHTKLYLTGGIGAAGGHEGFGRAYDLPNLSAYCETCAAIGMCLWNHRMFLMTGDSKYMDVLERSLYNGVLSGVSLDGERFFYPNPLESDGRHARSEWFSTSCCPSNICRFIPSVPGYAYAVRENTIYVNLYFSGSCEAVLDSGPVTVTQQTNYPWDGSVRLTVQPQQEHLSAELRLRVPGWARGEALPGGLYRFLEESALAPTLEVNSKAVEIQLSEGYAVLARKWSPGDVVELHLPMPVRRVVADERVAADVGKAALQRGPIVFCVEHPDVPEGQVVNLVIADTAELQTAFDNELLGGVQVVSGSASTTRWVETEEQERIIASEPVSIQAIPYYAWAHRGRGEMAVWLPRSVDAARPLPMPTTASLAKATASRGNPLSLADQREPRNSDDHSNAFLHFWPRRNTTEWLQYDFDQPTEVSAVEVYWFDDKPRGGGCRVPQAWRLLYRSGDRWLPVAEPSGYRCERDQYNRCEFRSTTTTALRLEIDLPQQFSSGVHEWRVEP